MKNYDLQFETLKLQNVETVDGSNNITGLYTFMGRIENTDFILVKCRDTKELFVISNSNLYK
jgi:hypothetical protein